MSVPLVAPTGFFFWGGAARDVFILFCLVPVFLLATFHGHVDNMRLEGAMRIQYVYPSTERSSPPSFVQPNPIDHTETMRQNMAKDMDEGDLLCTILLVQDPSLLLLEKRQSRVLAK